MFVMTVDQRNSSTSNDLVPLLQEELASTSSETAPLLEFQRTAGDEVQAVFQSPKAVLDTALFLSRQGNWHIGIGAGSINEPLPHNARDGNGQAYINARTAVDRAKRSPGHIAFEGTSIYSALIDASLQLVMSLEEERNDSWQEVGELYSQGLTQKAIAEKLGTFQSAVSRSLKQGRWHETRRILKELVVLLEEER